MTYAQGTGLPAAASPLQHPFIILVPRRRPHKFS